MGGLNVHQTWLQNRKPKGPCLLGEFAESKTEPLSQSLPNQQQLTDSPPPRFLSRSSCAMGHPVRLFRTERSYSGHQRGISPIIRAVESSQTQWTGRARFHSQLP